MKPCPLLTVRQAAELLGMGNSPAAGRRLAREIAAVERSTGKKVWVRMKRARFITEPLLREYLPHRFARRDELAGMIRKELEDMREDARVNRLLIEALMARVAVLEKSQLLTN